MGRTRGTGVIEVNGLQPLIIQLNKAGLSLQEISDEVWNRRKVKISKSTLSKYYHSKGHWDKINSV